jgi:hypothetical protein
MTRWRELDATYFVSVDRTHVVTLSPRDKRSPTIGLRQLCVCVRLRSTEAPFGSHK